MVKNDSLEVKQVHITAHKESRNTFKLHGRGGGAYLKRLWADSLFSMISNPNVTLNLHAQPIEKTPYEKSFSC